LEHDSIEQPIDSFPIAAHAAGGFTADGRGILLEIQTKAAGPIRLCLHLSEVQDFVTFLLRLAAQGPTDQAAPRTEYQPIPVSTISAGEFTDGTGLLGVTVGSAELVFEIPAQALPAVARTLMAVVAPADKQRMI
jgi:hypothetical protein